ncbi:MAG: hypothetical protein C0504_03770 [Candidatus Solibacter sp.]|nr:hypothetical protein [Candidatus Solibacter sp.]
MVLAAGEADVPVVRAADPWAVQVEGEGHAAGAPGGDPAADGGDGGMDADSGVIAVMVAGAAVFALAAVPDAVFIMDSSVRRVRLDIESLQTAWPEWRVCGGRRSRKTGRTATYIKACWKLARILAYLTQLVRFTPPTAASGQQIGLSLQKLPASRSYRGSTDRQEAIE